MTFFELVPDNLIDAAIKEEVTKRIRITTEAISENILKFSFFHAEDLKYTSLLDIKLFDPFDEELESELVNKLEVLNISL